MRRKRSRRPGSTTIEALAEHLGIDAAATSKAMPVVTGDRLVLALVRGDDRLSEEKLETLFEASFRPATDEEIRATSAPARAPSGRSASDFEVIADEALREGQFVAGANRDGRHLRGVEAGRDFEPRSPTSARRGRATPARVRRRASSSSRRSRSATSSSSARSTREPLGARFLDEDGQEKPLVMGSYGIGPGPDDRGDRRAAPR